MTPSDINQGDSHRRIAIISDTHGIINQNILEVVKTCDRVIHAGDICGAHVLTQLEEVCSQVTAVRGNNDAPELWADDEAAVVSQIPSIAEIELPGGTLCIEHGHKHGMHQPKHCSLRESHPHAKVIVYGHTHKMVIDDETTPWVVNPGAAGSTRTNGGPSCMVLTAHANREWDIEMLRFEEEHVA